MNAWERVQLARDAKRPTASYYINSVFDSFVELHGDRNYGDDPAIVGGIAYLSGRAVTVIGQEKGGEISDKMKRNFGSPHPEGYRKTLRLMEQAEKFGRPIICIVDTQGAFCGVGAEERGQGQAIAQNLMRMMTLRVPIVSVLIGEGGSGGALAMAVADRVLMLENAIYSILSPEGFASILWKDASRAEEAAENMKLTANDLYTLEVIDGVIPEPEGGAHVDPLRLAKAIKDILVCEVSALKELDTETLLALRYEKFRSMGETAIL